ncbi:MAG TPA: hemolysin family protein [Ignavibacteriaceae bacterium]|nr:hemolysin family protein [Ignavibacteriaceae bacterium]
MEVEWFVKLFIILILLLGSAFFSGSEVALFSLDKKKLDSNFNRSGIIYRYLINLISYPRRLLVTILIGNTIVNVAASIVAVSIAIDLSNLFNISLDLLLTFQILIITILILLFGELFPKMIASKNPVKFAKYIAVPLNICTIIIYPVAEIIAEILRLSSSSLKFDKSKSAISNEELVELTNIGKEKGAIEEGEHSLISSIVMFAGITVDEVMTPRVDIVAVPAEENYDGIIKTITNSGHSRIPVYKNNLDEIIGIIFAKDLLKFIRVNNSLEKFSLESLMKKPLFVPETKPINELLKEFQEKKVHLAIVVDEYGGTSGLITLEDIIEEVLGDIWDEFDKEEDEIISIDDKRFIALGKTKLDDLNEQLHTNIIVEDNDYDTLGGFIFNKAGNIPKEGFSFVSGNFRYTVKEIQKRRIKKVMIEKI